MQANPNINIEILLKNKKGNFWESLPLKYAFYIIKIFIFRE